MNYDFDERLAFSRGTREKTDILTLQHMIDGCVSVIKTDLKTDKSGTDYIATLRRGAQILIDAKARNKGARKYWRSGVEVALEIWSVSPAGKQKGKAGWTLCEQKNVDLILFTFAPEDTPDCYLVSFQLLRMAFHRNLTTWRETYRRGVQSSGTWESECLFVPVSVVLRAIQDVQKGHLHQLPIKERAE